MELDHPSKATVDLSRYMITMTMVVYEGKG